MSQIPDNLKYTKEHEWVRLEENGTVVVGITDYAQSSLGDITFVELPETDESFTQGATFGVVESVKAASDLYMPVAGKVIENNAELMDTPELVNSDPYREAWLVRIQPEDPSQLEGLLDAAAYAEIVG
ncbi:MAG: glycine cleavage system protein GcvH [Opitutales bacterium]|jgi:glycine cleavage system H protein